MDNFKTALLNKLTKYKVDSKLTFFDRYEIGEKAGSKYTKIFKNEIGHDGNQFSSSIICFVNNETGDIFKPAGAKAPAKHMRGNIHSINHGMEAFGENGFVKYLK